MAQRFGILSARRLLNSPLFVDQVTISRQDAGEYNEHGEWVAGTASETTYNASVEPLSNKDAAEFRNMSEAGYRLEDAFKFFIATTDRNIATAVRIGTDQTQPDIITYEGERYIIISVKPFTNHGHTAIVATREDN